MVAGRPEQGLDTVCVGSLAIDILVASLPREGENLEAGSIRLAAGGCALRVAVDLKKSGRSVMLCGAVGTDRWGDLLIREVRSCGLPESGVIRSARKRTSVTIRLGVGSEALRCIHYEGANEDFSLASVDQRTIDNCRVLFLGGCFGLPQVRPDDVSGFRSAPRVDCRPSKARRL